MAKMTVQIRESEEEEIWHIGEANARIRELEAKVTKSAERGTATEREGAVAQ